MDRQEFEQQLQELRRGELRLEPPEANGLSLFASGGLYEIKQYIAALECAYRLMCEKEDQRQRDERVKAATAGKIAGRMWSEGACLGYAVMGLRGANFKPDEAVRVLEAMEEAMEVCGLDEAAQAHQDLIEGRRSEAPE